MSNKWIAIIGAVALLTAFAVGRWSAPEKVKIQTVTIDNKTDDKQTDKNKHKKTTITETTKPDGTKTKTTVITDDDSTMIVDHKTDDKTQTTTKEIDKSTSKVTISLLGAVDITNPTIPTYGLSVTKPILGPLTVGIFGFRDGTVGASVGLTF